MDFTIKNGWILSLASIILSYAPLLFGGKAVKRLTFFSWMGQRGKLFSFFITVFSILFLLIPIFCSITENLPLLICGIVLFVIGSIGTIISYQNYFTTPLDSVITKGMYRISRNPIYVFLSISIAGIAILCASYVMGAILLLNIIFQHPVILEEEKFCAEKYGNDYINYKKNTRRYL